MSSRSAAEGGRGSPELPLPASTKLIYGLGDHTINLALTSLAFFYAIFLTDVAEIRVGLAGLVPLIGRIVDAISDPAMGRISDLTRWRAGRRRPYLLIGMVPLGIAYASLWWNVPLESQSGRFAYYVSAYVCFTLSTTIVGVPYLALLPELAADYQERTSLNTYRAALALVGALLAVTTLRPLTELFGGSREGFAAVGALFGLWMILPWLPIYRVTRERAEFRRPPQRGLLEGLKVVARHGTYLRLTGFYLLGRTAIDLATVMFVYYFTYWLGRPEDFELTMGIFLLAVIGSLPVWLRISRRTDKRTIFLLGSAWWFGAQMFLLFATPEWPRQAILFAAALAGVGYAVADMMPWSMLGDVVDEDELRTGERREGIYTGFFTFLRKLAGASSVALALGVLDWVGYQPHASQSPTTLWTIRILTAALPGVFVALAGYVALGYPIGRARHAEILATLESRRGERDALRR